MVVGDGPRWCMVVNGVEWWGWSEVVTCGDSWWVVVSTGDWWCLVMIGGDGEWWVVVRWCVVIGIEWL